MQRMHRARTPTLHSRRHCCRQAALATCLSQPRLTCPRALAAFAQAAALWCGDGAPTSEDPLWPRRARDHGHYRPPRARAARWPARAAPRAVEWVASVEGAERRPQLAGRRRSRLSALATALRVACGPEARDWRRSEPLAAPRRLRAAPDWPGGGPRPRWGRPMRRRPILGVVVAAYTYLTDMKNIEIFARLYLRISSYR